MRQKVFAQLRMND